MRSKLSVFTIIMIFTCMKGQAQNVGIGTNTPAHPLTVVASISTGSSAAIFSVNSGSAGNAVMGVSNAVNSNGVQGSSNNGTGVLGYTNQFRAISGIALSGTGLYGNSVSGYGLEVVGNIKLSGGNTNPLAGAVLTSDATGNAVWKPKKVGFSVSGENPNLLVVNSLTNTTVHLFTEEYDYGNNYNAYSGLSPSFGHSTFVAPVSGLYHFDAALALSDNDDLEYPILSLIIQRGATTIVGAQAEFSPVIRNIVSGKVGQAVISKDVKLVSGDIVYLRVYHSLAGGASIWRYGAPPHFGGHLVFAE